MNQVLDHTASQALFLWPTWKFSSNLFFEFAENKQGSYSGKVWYKTTNKDAPWDSGDNAWSIALRPAFLWSRQMSFGWFYYNGYLAFTTLPESMRKPIFLFSQRNVFNTVFFKLRDFMLEKRPDGYVVACFDEVSPHVVNATEVVP